MMSDFYQTKVGLQAHQTNPCGKHRDAVAKMDIETLDVHRPRRHTESMACVSGYLDRLLNWFVGLGWVGCQQPGGKQVFGTFDHVALPLDFCFPGFVSTEARKLNQGRSVGFMLFFFGIMFCCF